jgi:hypothetical protein
MLLVCSLSSGSNLRAEGMKDDHGNLLVEMILLQFLISYPNLQNVLYNIYSLVNHIPHTNTNHSPENAFGESLVQAGDQLIAESSLVYVIHKASSTYGGWRLDGDEWDMVYNAWCWELLGILIYESGYSTDPNLHNAYVHEIEHTWSHPENYPVWVPSPGVHSFQAGDLIFMNGGDHVAIATGNGEEVLSLWNRPDRFLMKINLTDLMAVWPFDQRPTVHKVSVKEVFHFLETVKASMKS